MAHESNLTMTLDQDLRNALIRANIALLQREIREKKDWYAGRRVVVRKRNGRIHLSRLGSRQQQSRDEYASAGSVDFEEDSQDGSFALVDEHISSRSSSFSSNY